MVFFVLWWYDRIVSRNLIRNGGIEMARIKDYNIGYLFVLGLCFILLMSACGKSDTPDVESEEGQPIVTITMDSGDTISLELYPDVAPNTVNNFISLIKDDYYDGLIFHRVIPGFMIQGGDPEGNGTGGPGYAIKGEFSSNDFENDLKH